MQLSELKNKKLVFFFPYYGVGGVQVYFVRTALYLEKQGYDIALVDYKNGYMHQSLPDTSSIEIIFFDHEKGAQIPENAVLIMQLLPPWSLRLEYKNLMIPDDTQLFFLTTHQGNILPAMPKFRHITTRIYWKSRAIWGSILRVEYQRSKWLLKLLANHDAIGFINGATKRNIEQAFNYKFKEGLFAPNQSDYPKQNFYLKEFKQKKELQLAWVGRISDFQIHIINRVIQDLDKYAADHQCVIQFHITGYGDQEEHLKQPKSDFLSIHRIKHIWPDKLPEFSSQMDGFFAMGIAALDAAILGVPTMCLNFSYEPIAAGYKYHFLYEMSEYDTCEQILSPSYKAGTHSMDDIMHQVINNKEALSKKTYAYFKKNHAIEHTSSLLLDLLAKSRLRWEELKGKKELNSLFFSLYKKWETFRAKKRVEDHVVVKAS
ncbi:MAG: hypothetical protein VW378_05260 [bacterium]